MRLVHGVYCAALAVLLSGTAARAMEPADTVYLGGTVQTLDAAASRAEAVAVRGGRVVTTGSIAEIEAYRGPATRVLALHGRVLLPGFIDGHSHLGHALQFLDWANLSEPPVGAVRDIRSLRETLRRHAQARAPARGEWLIGYGYSRESLAEARELGREDLDADFPDNPVMVMHVSGHGAVFNSVAFRLAGVDANTRDPPGGLILRRPGGSEPAGLVMETALFPFMALLPKQDPAQVTEALRRAQTLYAANGYTTIQEGATDPGLLAQLRCAAAEGQLFLDVVALPVVAREEDFAAALAQDFGRYDRHLKLGGLKFLLDGSPQGRTAWFTEPLLTGGPGGETDWRGKPFMPPEDYLRDFAEASARRVPVWTHANGDAAIDLVVEAHRRVGARPSDDRRNVVIHSQFVRQDQLEAYAQIGIAASFFSNHAFFWGDVHLRNLGERRARFLSPLAAATDLGLRVSNHTDYGVTPLDPLFTLWTATTRQTRSGRTLGPDQRVDTLTALRALTTGPAWFYREETEKGSIEAGKRADFVLLDDDPLAVDPSGLRGIKIVATVKDDKLVYGAF